MSIFQPIIATLEYETGDYRELKLEEVDISAHLILCLDREESVEGLAAEPDEWENFGEVVADDIALNEEGWEFRLRSDFSLFDELLKATGGRYGDEDLLSMWRGWKAEALAAGVLEAKSVEVAEAVSASLNNQISNNVFVQGEAGLRALFATILKKPGSFEALQAELSKGDYSPLDAMAALGKIQA